MTAIDELELTVVTLEPEIDRLEELADIAAILHNHANRLRELEPKLDSVLLKIKNRKASS